MSGVATETHHPMLQGLCVTSSAFHRPGQPFLGYTYPDSGTGAGGSYDVTDNKTNEVVPLYTLKRIYTMSDAFHRESERLKTFDNWPLEWMDKIQLARTGMFYTGEADKVKCYFCEVEIGRWEHEDQPVSEHLRWSPNCPLLRRRTTNNMPISAEALDHVLPPVSYDICGANDAIEVRPHAYAEGTIASPRMMTSTAVNTSGGNGSYAASSSSGTSYLSNCTQSASHTTYFPEYPEYAIEAARIRSFSEWPRHMTQKPEQLAEAGFFYTGVGDRVKCFSCGCGLKDWDSCDEPWEQHAIWMGKCRYLKLIKGQNYIDAIIAKQKIKDAGEPIQEDTEANTIAGDVKATTIAAAAGTASVSVQPNCDVAPEISVTPATTRTIDTTSVETNLQNNDVVATVEATSPASPASPALAISEKKPHSSIREEKLCKICYADEYNTAFLPCGHVVACAKCASSVTKCPLCRKPFTDVMRVYFS